MLQLTDLLLIDNVLLQYGHLKTFNLLAISEAFVISSAYANIFLTICAASGSMIIL